MYEPFPGNYVWNLSVNICIGMGGAIGEIDKANERVRDLAKQGEDAGTEELRLSRDSLDEPRTGVNFCAFPAFWQDKRVARTTALISGSSNGD